MAGGPVRQPYDGVAFIPQSGIYEFGYRKDDIFLLPHAISIAYLSGVEEVSYHFGVLARGLIKKKQ